MKKSAKLMLFMALPLAMMMTACESGVDATDLHDADAFDDVDQNLDVPDALDTTQNPDLLEDTTHLDDCYYGEYGDPMVMMTNYRVVSFNVMCSVCDNSYDPWEKRLTYFGDMFDRIKPDLVGLQELIFDFEVNQIVAEMPGYAAVYYPGDGGDFFAYPDAAVLYRTDRFELVESGWYWLSPTPEVPWSMGYSEGQSIPRIVVWVHLSDRDAGNKDIYFATTHYDSTHPHQENAAPQMIQTVEPWAAQMPVIQTGDFNTEPRDPAFNILTNGIDGEGFHFDDAFIGENNGWSFVTNQDPVPLYDPMNRIDHVLTAGGVWDRRAWTVDLYKFGDVPRFPSDHRLIWADLTLSRELNCHAYRP